MSPIVSGRRFSTRSASAFGRTTRTLTAELVDASGILLVPERMRSVRTVYPKGPDARLNVVYSLPMASRRPLEGRLRREVKHETSTWTARTQRRTDVDRRHAAVATHGWMGGSPGIPRASHRDIRPAIPART